jgi:hypothetical protein
MNWKGIRLPLACLITVWASLLGVVAAVAAPAARVHYALTGAIPGPDGPWDYMSIDAVAHRLYLSHNGAATLDVATHKWERTLDRGARVSTVLPLHRLNRLIFSEGSSASVVIANLATHRILGRVSTGIGPDGMTFDPKTGLAVVMAHGFAALVNVAHMKLVARVPVGGDLEFPASNGNGTVYINVSSAGEIAVLDLAKRAIVSRFRMKDCREPKGLAYDAASHLLISACDGMAAVMSAHGDRVHLVKELRTGTLADAVFVDPKTRLAFVPCGGDGTLTIIDLRDAAHPRVAQVVKTQKGARTGTVDPTTGTVYLQVAKLGPVPPGGYWPSAVPGTYRVLVLKPMA